MKISRKGKNSQITNCISSQRIRRIHKTPVENLWWNGVEGKLELNDLLDCGGRNQGQSFAGNTSAKVFKRPCYLVRGLTHRNAGKRKKTKHVKQTNLLNDAQIYCITNSSIKTNFDRLFVWIHFFYNSLWKKNQIFLKRTCQPKIFREALYAVPWSHHSSNGNLS